MRQWFSIMGVGLIAAAPVQAGSMEADLAISVTVIDQCLVHTDSLSANCAGGAGYALGVGRERIGLTRDQLTAVAEHAHTAGDGSHLGTSQSIAGSDGREDFANGAVRTIAAASMPIDAIRVTYSF